MAVFSAKAATPPEVITGAVSLMSVTVTVIACAAEVLTPSEAVTVTL